MQTKYMKQFSFGAKKSKKDKRTIKHKHISQEGVPLLTGGIVYNPQDIENQANVGICTAISFVQNREKANNKKYSAEFQYLLQKKYFDLNWEEGSSILNALKVGMKYGLLPANLWTFTTLSDRDLPYSSYIAKLQAITDTQIQSLLTQCVDKIPGYASVNVSDPQAIARAINESQAGILCMYEVGQEWYTSVSGVTSWAPFDIDPLRPPKTIEDGHAINMSQFNYTTANNQILANTWSPNWDKQGCADICWDNYKPIEAWIITKNTVIYRFNNNLSLGMQNADVTNLQNALKIKGYFTLVQPTGYYGILTYLAVKAFQKANGIIATGNCYQLTRACLNSLFNL
jgi:peptidoglycan hydrolase-like protein with peptidoglycan-binding domain